MASKVESLEEGELEDIEEEEGEIVVPKPRFTAPKNNKSRGERAHPPQQPRATAPPRNTRGTDWATKRDDDFESLLKSYVQNRGPVETVTTEYKHVDKKRKRDNERNTTKVHTLVEPHRSNSKRGREKSQYTPQPRRDQHIPKSKNSHAPVHIEIERTGGRGGLSGGSSSHTPQSRKEQPRRGSKFENVSRGNNGSDESAASSQHTVSNTKAKSPTNMNGGVHQNSNGNGVSTKDTTTRRNKPPPKLELIVDIDHTLVHSTTDPKAKDIFETAANATDMVQFTLPGQASVYYVKFRPRVSAFLDLLQPMFDFHIYTMGTRAYAEKIISILDPHKQLFGRILAREDHNLAGDRTTKNLENYFAEDKVLILDDRDDVWRQSGSANLIKVDPFLFFEGLSDSNAPPLNPLSIQELAKVHPFPMLDKSENLDSLVSLLQSVHKEYFETKQRTSKEVDVREILAKIRSRVLAGCHVVFSGIFPLQIDHSKLPNTKIWKTTEHFGATVSLDINEHTTHVIAVKSGTLKVSKAQQMGVKVIHLGWLRDCVKYFTKLDEGPYLLPITSNSAHSKPDRSTDV